MTPTNFARIHKIVAKLNTRIGSGTEVLEQFKGQSPYLGPGQYTFC
jgi:hypothetical protein